MDGGIKPYRVLAIREGFQAGALFCSSCWPCASGHLRPVSPGLLRKRRVDPTSQMRFDSLDHRIYPVDFIVGRGMLAVFPCRRQQEDLLPSMAISSQRFQTIGNKTGADQLQFAVPVPAAASVSATWGLSHSALPKRDWKATAY